MTGPAGDNKIFPLDLNIEGLGEQNSLFPFESVIKCLVMIFD